MLTPAIVYGTAWKEDATADCVKAAVAAGYRAFDTANQKKHYREDFAGQALLELMSGRLTREELFLQSKFTYRDGHDHRVPYDAVADYPTQVKSSFAGTLRNLHVDYLDSFLMHSPSAHDAWSDPDREVWTAFEELHSSGKARMIGVSNVAIHHLRELWRTAKIRPAIVQNRCYAVRGWDREVREFCTANGVAYQGFSLLTANPHVLGHAVVQSSAQRHQVTPAQVVLAYGRQIGILPLTGTTNPRHMKDDLESLSLSLLPAEVAAITNIGADGL